jgi:hypothetical protein
MIVSAPLVRKATVTGVPTGISVSAARPGEEVKVAQRGTFTSDDGPHVYTFLDAFVRTAAFAPLFQGLDLAAVTGFLINVVNRTEVTAWINPPVLAGSVISREPIMVGSPIFAEQIAQISEVELGGVDPEPTEGATVYACRVGWRLGLYFDLSMLDPEPRRPIENLRRRLGQVHTLLSLRDRLRFTDIQLRKLYEQGWFPFIGLAGQQILALYHASENGWPLNDLEREIVEAISPRVPAMIETWKQKAPFLALIRNLSEAARLFRAGEHQASHAIALPCVEGVLRRMYLRTNSAEPNYAALRKAMVREAYERTRGKSALLPEQFSEFLDAYHLAPFDHAADDAAPTRHAVTHGVATGDGVAWAPQAVRLFLTLEQIFFYA